MKIKDILSKVKIDKDQLKGILNKIKDYLLFVVIAS